MKTKFTIAALRAAKVAQAHVHGTNFTYAPEEAAISIDEAIQLPEIIRLIDAIVDDAKRDLASNPDWQGPTVRIPRGKLKELSNLLQELQG